MRLKSLAKLIGGKEYQQTNILFINECFSF